MAYWVYIIRCKDNSFYTGITGNLGKRFQEHQQGKVPYTKNKRPLGIAYQEKFNTRKEAAGREKEIKGWRREKKEKLIKNFKVQNK